MWSSFVLDFWQQILELFCKFPYRSLKTINIYFVITILYHVYLLHQVIQLLFCLFESEMQKCKFNISRTYLTHYPYKVPTLAFWDNSCGPQGHQCPMNFFKIVLLQNVNLVPKRNYINLTQIIKFLSKLILNTFNQLTKKCYF